MEEEEEEEEEEEGGGRGDERDEVRARTGGDDSKYGDSDNSGARILHGRTHNT